MIWYPLPMVNPAEALRQIYSGYVQTLEGVSDFLRDDLPGASPGVSKWVQSVGRRACRKYARQRGNVPFLTSDPSWDGICSGYWDAISEGPTTEGSYAPPFSGGQCPLPYTRGEIPYTFYYSKASNPNVTLSTSGNTVAWSQFGPARYGPISFGSRGWEIAGSTLQAFAVINYKNSLGQSQTAKATFAQVAAEAGFGPAIGRSLDLGGLNLTSGSGNPDNCGDPDSEYRPPTFPPNLPPLPPPTNPAPGFGNNWDVEILPDGQVSICIGGECSTGTPPGGGSGPDSAAGPGEPDGAPQETDPNDPDTPNEISGCVEDGRLLTGIKINFTQIPPHQAPLGDIYYRVCWVWMGPDSDKLDMVMDGRTMQNGQFVIPDSRDCTCYKVRANAGWRLEVQPYSRPKEE